MSESSFEDQPLRILHLLLQHPGDVVTREQIQSELWPADTYVDYENAINSSVRKLREALGDSPSNPRFIETLSRRGYRLLVPVSRNGGDAAPPSQPRPELRRFPRRAIVAASALLSIATAIVLLTRPRSLVPIELTPAVPLTSYPGEVCCPSFSPDGTRVAFAWTGPSGDVFHIYVKLIGQGDPVALTTGNPEDKWPAWSPDGRWIAFERYSGDVSVLVKPAMGGLEREIAHLGTWDRGNILAPLSWSADGRSLFAVDGGPKTWGTWITRLSFESGDRVRTTLPGPEYRDELPAVSPDGTRLAFTRQAGYWHDIYIAPLAGPAFRAGTVRRVTSDSMLSIGSLAWTPDGRYLIFVAARGAGSAVWQVAADGPSRPASLIGGGENSHHVAISRQGRLIYSTSISVPHLWQVRIGRDSKTPAARFLPSTRQQMLPQYSPDGRRVAFQSDRSGNQEIWVADAAGVAPAQLTSLRAWSGTPRWSPGGDRIAFDSNRTGKFQIYVISSGGGQPVQLTTRGSSAVPNWSRDGKWIYFASDQTPRGDIWKVSASGGSPVQVTRNGGTIAQEGASGRELYFTKSATFKVEGESKVWRMPLPDGAEEQVAGPLAGRNFEAGTRGVYFIEEPPSGAILKFFPYGGHSAETIAPLGGKDYMGITISPDERVALYSRFEVSHSELMLVESFGRKAASFW